MAERGDKQEGQDQSMIDMYKRRVLQADIEAIKQVFVIANPPPALAR